MNPTLDGRNMPTKWQNSTKRLFTTMLSGDTSDGQRFFSNLNQTKNKVFLKLLTPSEI